MDHFHRQELEDALATRILVLDGAMGSILQARLRVEDYGGAHLENCTDNVSRANPGVVYAVHTSYLAAGADIIETNSFNGHPVSLAEFQLEADAYDINYAAAALARTAADEYSALGRQRWVAGAMGPTTRSITVTRNVDFRTLRDGYYLQARALIEGGADLLLVETCQDTRNVKAALLAIDELERELGIEIPVMVSGTIEPMGTMLAGQTADAFCASIAHRESAGDRPQLRDRSGVHDRPHPHHARDGPHARLLLSERRPPERGAASTSRRRSRSPPSSNNSSTTAG